MPLRVTTPIPIQARRRTTSALAAADTLTPTSIVLGVDFVRQTQSQWCWAACTQMVASYLKVPDLKQCELANFLHNQTTCCVTGSSTDCDQPCQFEGIGLVYDQVGIDSISERKIIYPQQLQQELTARRPIEVGWLWNGGGGHVVLIVGMNANGMYQLLDPMFGTRICNYQAILLALGMGWWAYSFGVFKKRGN